MAEEGTNYTPLSTFKSSQQKKSFSLSNKTLALLIVFLTIGVGMVSFLFLLRKPLRPKVPAYLSGEASACDIKIGPPISGSEKIEGNKYSIQVPVENKSNAKKGVRLSTGWFACPFNDKQTCTDGDAHRADQEHTLGPKEKKLITVTAEQPTGACGSLQIELKIKAVKKNIDDDDDNKGGGDKITIVERGWDETCNTNSTWVGGFYTFPQACGVAPTAPPTPTPTSVAPTTTPTPSGVEPTIAPSPTEAGPTATETPTLPPEGTGSPTPTSTLTPSPTTSDESGPTPTSGKLAQGPTATPIPVACGTKSCDAATNPCRSGLVCLQANDGSNYCSQPEYQDACKVNPSQISCCTGPGDNPAPTEIVLVNATATPGQAAAASGVKEIPSVGIATFGKIFTAISLAVILLGLIL